jgi:hypothetical protein
MSFLDNLENNLKTLESGEQGGVDDRKRREEEKARAQASAPWAERLKQDPWTQTLMQRATKAGYQRRTKINLAWIGTTLRLEARGRRLELRPQPDGISAVFLHGTEESKRQPVDLKKDSQKLVAEWMVILDEQKKLDDEQAKAFALQDREDEEDAAGA